MLPIDPNHERNRRDDDHTDFDQLKATGQVRNKQGRIIALDEPCNTFSAFQRDEFYQAYCQYVRLKERTPTEESEWINAKAMSIGISPTRAKAIINEGNGQYAGENMQWWRGVSLQ